jgi:hypothetical protein
MVLLKLLSLLSVYQQPSKERVVYHDALFNRFAKWASCTAGHPSTFAAAALILLPWALTPGTSGICCVS